MIIMDIFAPCSPVQQKLPCIYMTKIWNVPSTKRHNQAFTVVATEDLNLGVQVSDIESAVSTEKIDGTCCLVQKFHGVAWLWARFDRKPNKTGFKKFRNYKRQLETWKLSDQSSEKPQLMWNFRNDFKEVPDNWIPASGLANGDGYVHPDDQGHTPGWVPVEEGVHQYCWHLSAIDADTGTCLVLSSVGPDKGLVIRCQPLSGICDRTCELFGTFVNGNPYGIGNKQHPIHLLVVHGSLKMDCPSPVNFAALREWFHHEDTDIRCNKVEGIVWHCPSGELYKLTHEY